MNYRCIYCSTTKIDDDLPHVLLDDENSVVQKGVCGFCLKHTLGISPELFLFLYKYKLSFVPILFRYVLNLFFKVNIFLLSLAFITAVPFIITKNLPFNISLILAIVYFFFLPSTAHIAYDFIRDPQERINTIEYIDISHGFLSLMIFAICFGVCSLDFFALNDLKELLFISMVFAHFYPFALVAKVEKENIKKY